MSRSGTPGSPGTAMSGLGASLAPASPEPSTPGTTTTGFGVSAPQPAAPTGGLPSVVSFAMQDPETVRQKKLATWGNYKGWYEKMRSWNVRIQGPVVTRHDRGMPGGTVVISDGRLPSYPADDDLYPACCFGCLRIDKVISNIKLTGS